MAVESRPVSEMNGVSRDPEHKFFSGMASAILITAVVGFMPSYFLRPFLPDPSPIPRALTPLIHLHSALFTSWLLLLLIQVRLVAGRRTDIHRKLGVLALALAAGMVVVGVLTTLHGVSRGVAPFGMDPYRFMIVPLFAIGLFALFVVAAILRRRDAQSHKRLMLLATIALLPPALARLVILLGLGAPFIFALATVFVVPLVVWDLRSLKHVHRVTLWAGLLLVLSFPLRFGLAQTDAWLKLAHGLTGLVQ